MAYISKIKALDGVTYNLKDATARKSNMSQSEATTGTSTTARYISAKVLNDTIASKAAQVVELTQAEYDALENPDPNVTYFITDSEQYGSEMLTTTLYAANWDSTTNVYTITDARVNQDTLQVVKPAEGITDTQLEALQGANIQAYGQDAGHLYLKAYGDLPSIDVPVSVIFHPGVTVREVEQQKQEIYSENETVVGTWIDGKPIYRKYFSFSLVNGVESISEELQNFDSMVKLYGTFKSPGSGVFTTIPYFNTGSQFVRAFIYIYNNSYTLRITAGGYYDGTADVFLEYTKTTD